MHCSNAIATIAVNSRWTCTIYNRERRFRIPRVKLLTPHSKRVMLLQVLNPEIFSELKHTYLCVFMCFLQFNDVLNVFWQYGHIYGRRSLWIPICLRRLPPVVKAPLHIRHLKAFNPVCVRIWAFSTPADTKPLPHWEHLNGFSPVCDL